MSRDRNEECQLGAETRLLFLAPRTKGAFSATFERRRLLGVPDTRLLARKQGRHQSQVLRGPYCCPTSVLSSTITFYSCSLFSSSSSWLSFTAVSVNYCEVRSKGRKGRVPAHMCQPPSYMESTSGARSESAGLRDTP